MGQEARAGRGRRRVCLPTAGAVHLRRSGTPAMLAELVLGVEAARTRLYAGACSRRYSGFAVLRPNDAAEAYVEMDGWQLVRAADGNAPSRRDSSGSSPRWSADPTPQLTRTPTQAVGCGLGP
jgi:hypothetical protein